LVVPDVRRTQPEFFVEGELGLPLQVGEP